MKKISNLINIAMLVSEMAKAKQLSKDVVTKAVQDAFSSLINKKFKGVIKVEALYLEDSDAFKFLKVRKVVDKDTSSPFELSLKEALTLDPNSEVGDEIFTELPDNTPELTFTRQDIIQLKQMINHFISGESKQELTKEYSSKIGKLMSGTVKQVFDHVIIVDLGKTEAKIPVKNLIPNYTRGNDGSQEVSRENFRVHDKINGVLVSVSPSPFGAELILSRTSNEFAVQILEKEYSEFEDGTIKIEKLARVAGKKTKVIVSSKILNEKQIMKTMLGENGFKVQNVSNQLNTEVINFVVEGFKPRETILGILKPIEPISMTMNEKSLVVVIDDAEVGKFLGSKNSNALLNTALLEMPLLMLTHSNMKKINEKFTNFLTSKGLSQLEAATFISSNLLFRSARGILQKLKVAEDVAANHFELVSEFLTANPIGYDASVNSHVPLWKAENKIETPEVKAQRAREELRLR